MSTYLLVHGAWFGGWCWDRLAPFLTERGHRVVTPDLPGHGRDRTPVCDITLQRFVERLCQVLEVQEEPVVLVGHSMGGIAISQAAELRPDKVQLLVYLTAYLLRDGETAAQMSQQDTGSLLRGNLSVDLFGGRYRFNEAALNEVLCGDCSQEEVAWIKKLIVREEALAPVVTRLTLTSENFGRIPRVYIECLNDRTISPALQRRMYTAVPCAQVVSMTSAHCPQISSPADLATHLDNVSALVPHPSETDLVLA
jgi:pimeloyl-ACP methyl ester carboxylesterase